MNDALSAALAEIRGRETKAAAFPLAELAARVGPDTKSVIGWVSASALDVPRLLAALDKVLELHAPRTDRVLGSSCFTHRNALNTMLPVPGCGNCGQDRQQEVCPECRDEFGDPVLFQDCRARSAILAALTGEASEAT